MNEEEKAKLVSTIKYVMNRVKHGPGGLGGAGNCDVDCLKCALSKKLSEMTV